MTILPTKKAAKDKSDQDKAAEHSGHAHGHGHNHAHAHNHAHGHPHFHYASGNESRHDKGTRARTSVASREDGVEARGNFDGHESATKYHKRRHKSPHRTARKHRGHSAVPPHPPPALPSPHSPPSGNPESLANQDDICSGYNSEDEHRAVPEPHNPELEAWFEQSLKTKGLIIKKMSEDGACLFRAVADQVYGDQEMHNEVRRQCIDFIEKNRDHFQAFVTEEIGIYLSRKRTDDCHGNAVELQAMSEMYNRPIEVYKYDSKPLNVGQQNFYETDNAPIRLSYHRNSHYNSVIDPYKATIGVGLGLPGLKPGLADENLMRDAIGQSENMQIEQAMLKDKMRETDWELTQEALEEQVARESYLCWVQETEKRQLMNRRAQGRSPSATCSTSAEGSSTSMAGSPDSSRPGRSPRSRSNPTSGQNSPQHPELPHCSAELVPQPHLPLPTLPECSASSSSMADEMPGMSQAMGFSETHSLMNSFPRVEGFLGENWDEEAVLQQVLAQSQQEYFDQFKKNSEKPASAEQQMEGVDDGDGGALGKSGQDSS